MKHQQNNTKRRWIYRISPIVLASALVLPAIPTLAAPDGSRSEQKSSKQQSVERHQGRSGQSAANERGFDRSRGRDDDRRYDRDRDRRDGRDHRRYDRDRDRNDRRDWRDRHDRYDRRDGHDRHNHFDRHRHRRFFYQNHVHRHYRPYFTIPRAITFGHAPRYDSYYWGRDYHEGHRHFHPIYLFPVYVDNDLVYRPYAYCNDDLYATGYFTAQGPLFDITLSF